MKEEFKRFGLNDKQRLLTGVLQVMGALGLFLGLYYAIIGLLASAGLSLLMLLGFSVRIKIRDSVIQSLPSFVFMVLNAFLCWEFLQLL